MSADARNMWGALTEGLAVPNDLNLSGRREALAQLGFGEAASNRLVSVARDYTGSERETGLLVSARQWPLPAVGMANVACGPEGEQGLRERLKAGLIGVNEADDLDDRQWAAVCFHLFPEWIGRAAGWLADGTMHTEQTVFEGIDRAPAAFLGMMRGANTGKMLVRLDG
ncbi:hypothetical protein [Streptomyces sp. ISL-94]|uniref:hypothetical protein n=1 Tax=Streptomyces sp. ISL-94 TaxID=2819190 RepID=UPI0020359618|nr:hypothetical protein [Streptomyces sp. ISL-94]